MDGIVEYVSPRLQSVAVNPSNPNEIVVRLPAVSIRYQLQRRLDLERLVTIQPRLTSADIPWLAAGNERPGRQREPYYIDVGGLAFNPTDSEPIDRHRRHRRLEHDRADVGRRRASTQLISSDHERRHRKPGRQRNHRAARRQSGPRLLGPAFLLHQQSQRLSFDLWPRHVGHYRAGWSVDYASSNPSFIVGIADWWGTEESGYSTNGGQTWTKFPTDNPRRAARRSSAERSPPARRKTSSGRPRTATRPYYTLNGGATWSPITLPA